MNQLIPFQFDNHIAHGAFVVIEAGVDSMLDHRDYPAALRELIGQSLAAMPLLATHSRFLGRINLQFQSEQAIKLLVAQVVQAEGAPLTVRAMAKLAKAATAESLDRPYAELLGSGILALMLEPADEAQPSRQAMVPIDGHSLAESLEGYFDQSEQLPTLVRLAASRDRVVGFMLQRLPLEHTKATEDYWDHLRILAGTLLSDELLATPPDTLMRRLFADEAWHFQTPHAVQVSCRCSREGISLLLISLGREEVDTIVAEQGKVEVTCEFCGKAYHYTRSDAASLFAALGSEPSPLKH
jgi:molecular chaperone Hsp33